LQYPDDDCEPVFGRADSRQGPGHLLWQSEGVARWSELTEFLATAPDRCLLSMEQLEDIVGTLPHSARTHRAYWYGDRPQVRAWRAAGFVLDHVAVGRGVTLRREQPTSATPESSETPADKAPEDDGRRRRAGDDAPDIVLVSCSSRKGSRPAAAKDLYTSALFRKKRAYAEASGVPWFILSAEHALVAPDEWLAPYDRYLPETPRSFRAAWGAWVAERLELLVGPLEGLEIEVHASAAYSQACSPSLAAKGAVVTRPLAGLRQGEQLAFYGSASPVGHTREPFAQPQLPDADTCVAALLDQDHAVTPAYFVAQDPAGLRVPGLYSWWVDEEGADDLSRATDVTITPGLVYAGLAGATLWPSGKRSTGTLWSRTTEMHLGGHHESSSFRRSLRALLSSPGGSDTVVDENSLTAWMHAHLRVVAVPFEDGDALGAMETVVLTALDPPLNLQGMPSTPLRRSLKELRRRVPR
jgi:Family of unknown function (DUF6884)/GIY-YIG catalytic domain